MRLATSCSICIPIFPFSVTSSMRALRESPGSSSSTEYLGTIGAVRYRALEGAGVAVLPRYFVERELEAGALSELFSKTDLQHDFFRLIWRAGHQHEDEIPQSRQRAARDPLAVAMTMRTALGSAVMLAVSVGCSPSAPSPAGERPTPRPDAGISEAAVPDAGDVHFDDGAAPAARDAGLMDVERSDADAFPADSGQNVLAGRLGFWDLAGLVRIKDSSRARTTQAGVRSGHRRCRSRARCGALFGHEQDPNAAERRQARLHERGTVLVARSHQPHGPLRAQGRAGQSRDESNAFDYAALTGMTDAVTSWGWPSS